MRNLLTQKINKNEIKVIRRRGTKKKLNIKKYSNLRLSCDGNQKKAKCGQKEEEKSILVRIIKDEKNKKIASQSRCSMIRIIKNCCNCIC